MTADEPGPRSSGCGRLNRTSSKSEGIVMDFSKQIDELEEHVADIKSSAQAAATESREKLEQRIDKAQADLNMATQTAKQEADTAASGARGKWAQMKTDVAAKVGQTRAKMDKQAARMDADAAAADADW